MRNLQTSRHKKHVRGASDFPVPAPSPGREVQIEDGGAILWRPSPSSPWHQSCGSRRSRGGHSITRRCSLPAHWPQPRDCKIKINMRLFPSGFCPLKMYNRKHNKIKGLRNHPGSFSQCRFSPSLPYRVECEQKQEKHG